MDDLYSGLFFCGLLAFIVVGVVLYLKWIFIKSAVEAGTAEAIERMLRKYTDLSDYMKNPLHSEEQNNKASNDFESQLNGWFYLNNENMNHTKK